MKEFTEEFLRQIDVHELLPQQEPFVMIGRLTYFDEVRTVAETTRECGSDLCCPYRLREQIHA